MRMLSFCLIAGLMSFGIGQLNAAQKADEKKVDSTTKKTITTEKVTTDDKGAHGSAAHAHGHAHDAMLPKKAIAVMIPTKGSQVGGTLMLVEKGKVVEITGEITGLTPGKHGFHVHEFGDISSADGSAAGSHYNPGGHSHGGLDSKDRHAGDLGNVTADASGKAIVNIKAEGLHVHFIVGRSLVVHVKEDDLKTQPSGDSGGRVGIAVIGIANEKPAAAPTTPSSGGKTTTIKSTK